MSLSTYRQKYAVFPVIVVTFGSLIKDKSQRSYLSCSLECTENKIYLNFRGGLRPTLTISVALLPVQPYHKNNVIRAISCKHLPVCKVFCKYLINECKKLIKCVHLNCYSEDTEICHCAHISWKVKFLCHKDHE